MNPKVRKALLLQQRRRFASPLRSVVEGPVLGLLTQQLDLFKDRDQPALAAGPEARLVGPDGEREHRHGGVLLQGQELDVGVIDLDRQDPRELGDGNPGEGAESLVLSVFGFDACGIP